MNFTIDDIVRQFDSGSFSRGQSYARKGSVIDARLDGDLAVGEVEGSGENVYEQTVYLKAGRRGVSFDGDCTCPVGHNCKHVVAVLLAILEQASPAPGKTMPAKVDGWLRQSAFVLSSSATQAGAAPAAAGQRLFCILIPDRRDGMLRIHLGKGRRRKDGSMGSASLQADLHRMLFSMPAYVQPEDEDLLRILSAMRIGSSTLGDINPTGRLGARVLDQFCAERRLWWAPSPADVIRGNLVPILPGPARQASLGWHADHSTNASLALRWRFDDGTPVEHVLATAPACYLSGGALGELVMPAQLAAIAPAAVLEMVRQAPVLKARQGAEIAARMVAHGLDRILPLPQTLETRRRRDLAPTPCLLLDGCSTMRHGHHDYAVLSFDYGGIMTHIHDEPLLRRIDGGTVELIERDMQREGEAAAWMAGFGFSGHGAASVMEAIPEDALALPTESAWLAFMRRDLPRLRADGWRIDIDVDFRYDLAAPQEWYAELNEESGDAGTWFALELGILVDGRRHALLPLLLEMIRSAPWNFDAAALAAHDDDDEIIVELPGMARVALPWHRIKPIVAALGELYFGERLDNALRLPITDAARLAELERTARLRWFGGDRLRELGRKLDGFDGIRPVDAPQGLQATLRPYQQAGLAWMQFLREYGFGGILADDMGLGKTIQTLAHILTEKEAGRLDRPALVVAPTSLMGNWQTEAARFAPGLRVLLLRGKERAALFDDITAADLVLTTYPLLGRDEAALRRQAYHLLILDEAQYIKNSRSKAAHTACLLDARHRLCLTGTPVQNHLGELWSQFHFLMPGLLGNDKTFNARYRRPIEQHGDGMRKDLLARRVKPFMLRRTKDKVATELPPKTEIEVPVEFGSAQRDLYETVRLAMDRKVRDEIDHKGLARSHIVILEALLKLRQVCCDPRLLKSATSADSAKLDTLMALLDNLMSEDRKVLVFSQFTSMLALIAEDLRARGIEFVSLTGDTIDRDGQVAAFQQNRVRVFLISLKAGGVGLNLTAADTVIHYDPWWNPASENQATDRAWRIGQDQPVFVYKLIARGTLEEKIQDMQRRKGALASALLDADGGLAPVIGLDDLQAIFARQPA